MNPYAEENSSKHNRVLDLYNRLLSGEVLNKNQLALEYGVNPRSIQRDIDDIREFFSNRMISGSELTEIRYDRSAKGYRLVNLKTTTLTNAELFAVTKILFESRALNKEEMKTLPLALSLMKTQYNTDVGLTMACAVINFLPPFLFYIFMQSKFKEGMTMGGVKG